MWKAILLCAFVALTAGNKVSFENYKLYRLLPREQREVDVLEKLYLESDSYEFWTLPKAKNSYVDVIVPPTKEAQFISLMDEHKIMNKCIVDNIQQRINETTEKGQSSSFDFTSFPTLDEIYKDLDDLAKKHPDKVQVIEGGVTHEGRHIKGVKIKLSTENTPGVFLEGGTNAREWMSPAVVMYIAHQLLAGENKEFRIMAMSYDWYIFPLFNPDGYVYTHTTNRLWTKTRKPHDDNCVGSNPDKNWGYKWNTSGVNVDWCSNEYPGSEPFSEIETKSMSEYIKSIQNNLTAYFSFYSNSHEVMYPFITDCNSTDAIMERQFERNMRIIAKTGLNSRLLRMKFWGYNKPIFNTDIVRMSNLNSGCSVSYIRGVYHKPLVLVYGLRNKYDEDDLLQHPKQIIPTGEKTMYSLVYMLKTASRLNIFKGMPEFLRECHYEE